MQKSVDNAKPQARITPKGWTCGSNRPICKYEIMVLTWIIIYVIILTNIYVLILKYV